MAGCIEELEYPRNRTILLTFTAVIAKPLTTGKFHAEALLAPTPHPFPIAWGEFSSVESTAGIRYAVAGRESTCSDFRCFTSASKIRLSSDLAAFLAEAVLPRETDCRFDGLCAIRARKLLQNIMAPFCCEWKAKPVRAWPF